jgi:hypothetical protein
MGKKPWVYPTDRTYTRKVIYRKKKISAHVSLLVEPANPAWISLPSEFPSLTGKLARFISYILIIYGCAELWVPYDKFLSQFYKCLSAFGLHVVGFSLVSRKCYPLKFQSSVLLGFTYILLLSHQSFLKLCE